MSRVVVFALVALLVPTAALAQPLASAAPSASEVAPAPTRAFPVIAPPPAPSQSASPPADDRPARSPAMRERNAPRSRAGATARGAVILVLLVFLAGYWVMKRVRRRF